MFKLIDLSQPVYDNCPNCPTDPPVRSKIVADHRSDGWHLEELTLTTHSGSHLDAPLHKIPGGKSIDQIDLSRFVGQALIADLLDCQPDQAITAPLLASRLSGDLADSIILLATGWGQKRDWTDMWLRHGPQLSPDAARWLIERKARAVGIDHYTIGGSETHEVLLKAGLWIAEDLRFPDEALKLPQPVEFWALPIHLKFHSGSFCRPVLVIRG